MAHQCVDVVEVAWAGPPPQREHLVRSQVVRVEHRSDVEHDAGTETATVGEDFDRALASVGGVDGNEAVVGGRAVGVAGLQAALTQGCTQSGGDVACFRVVDLGEQVDVVGCTVDEAVGDHRSAAGEGDGVRFGQRGRRADDQIL